MFRRLPQIVIDTNVIYAAVRSGSGASSLLVDRIDTGEFDVHVSVSLILEYTDVLMRNLSILQITATAVEELVGYI